MITVIIGRDHQTNQLYRKVNGKAQLIKQDKAVPNSVGKEHVSLTITDDGKMILKNLNVQNYTYVNMVGIESKLIKEGDRIELGTEHYVLDWLVIKSFMPKFADIRPLRKVWEDYHNKSVEIKKRNQKMATSQSFTPILTTANIAISAVAGAMGHVNVCFITIPLVLIGVILMIKNYLNKKNDTSIEDNEKLLEEFHLNYVCPNCGHFLENRPYNILVQDTKCRYCQAIYKK